MKFITTLSANAFVPTEVSRVEKAVAFVRQTYRDEGFVTHVDKREVACGQILIEYTITAIKEVNDER